MATPTSSRPSRIVVIAFGPADLTRAARHRAQRLVGDDGDVVVVAAHRGAVSEPSMPLGTDGLRSVLEPTDAPVLLLHDDVAIGRDGVAAMMRGWHAAGHVIVPWSHIPDTSHHVNEAVPADDDARMRLARRLPLRGGRATTVRPVCLLADSARLRDLAGHFLTVADSIWTDLEVTMTVAAKALAYHNDRCVMASTPPGRPDDGPLLVAAMIVRDEGLVLGDCLASLDGLVERIEICDTGSTDDTVEIAESFGANVIHRPWRDDFAWARNQVLDQCQDATYILQIDADERARFDDPAAVRRRLAMVADSATALSVSIDNLNDAGGVSSTHDAARVLRPDRITYRGALHERPWSADGATVIPLQLGSLRLAHLGYQWQMVVERSKSARNVEISERSYQAAPNWETAFQYARSLSLAGGQDDERITELLHETLEAGDAVPVTWRAWSLAKLGRDALTRHEDEAAIDFAQQALRLVPADSVAGAVLAEAAQRLGRSDLILEQRTTRRSTVSPKPFTQLADATARLAGAEIATLLEYGATDDAYDEASAALRADPAHFRAWPALVRSVAGADETDTVDALLLAAAQADNSGECMSAIVRTLPADRSARLCARYVRQGGSDPRIVRDGLATAIVAGDPMLVDQFLVGAHRLEPAVLERLAHAAAQRDMEAQSKDLRTLAALPRRNFVICGTAMSGTERTSKILTALGHPCGHEVLFGPFTHTSTFGALQGDASWFALPHVEDLAADVVIFHQVRDPIEVVRSMIGSHMLTEPSPYLDFVATHAPEVLAYDDEPSRCMAYWLEWNRRLARHLDRDRPYVRYQVEELTPDVLSQLVGLLGSVQPAEVIEQLLDAVPDLDEAGSRDASITLASLPDGPLKADMLRIAAEFGYELAPV